MKVDIYIAGGERWKMDAIASYLANNFHLPFRPDADSMILFPEVDVNTIPKKIFEKKHVMELVMLTDPKTGLPVNPEVIYA